MLAFAVAFAVSRLAVQLYPGHGAARRGARGATAGAVGEHCGHVRSCCRWANGTVKPCMERAVVERLALLKRESEDDAALELQEAFAAKIASAALLEMNDIGGGRLAILVASRCGASRQDNHVLV